MLSSSIAWLLLSHYWGKYSTRRIKDEDDDISIKDESDEEAEGGDTIKKEEIEESTNIPPLSVQFDNEGEDGESIARINYDNDSGRGTAFDDGNIIGAQRRRSHLSDLSESW